MGEYIHAAEGLATRELAAAERRYGAGSPETIEPTLLLAHARILCEGAQRREGMAMLDRITALDRKRKIADLERAVLAQTYGLAYSREFQYDSAIVKLKLADSLMAKAVGTESPRYAETVYWLGRALQGGQRSNVEALPYLERASAITERTLGRDNALWFLILEKLATTKHYVFPGGSLEAYVQVHAGLQRHLGPQAPRLIFTYFGLANLYNILGDQQEVKRVCREGMAMVDANGDDCSIGAAYIYDVAGGAAYAEGDWKRADSLWTECLKVVTRTRSMDDLGAVFARSYRAEAWYQMNRIDDAEREYRALDPVMRKLFGSSSDMVAGNSLWIGKCALARGDTAQARRFLVESAETHRDFLRANFSYLPDRTTGPADYELALCDWLSGRVREAFDVSLLVEADTRARLRWQARTLSDKDALALEEQRTEGLSLALTALLAGGLDEAAKRRAFDAVVRSRAVVLDAVTARHLTARASSDSLARAIGDTLRIVQRQLSAAVVRASNSDEVPGRVGLEQQRRALTSRLSRLEPALARSFEGGSVGADEVASALPSGSRLVSFVRFQRRMEAAGSLVDHRRSEPWYAAFVLGGGEAEVRVHDLGSAAVLDHEIEQWTQAIALATDSNAENAARQPLGDRLRRRMWDVLASETPEETRVFVVPDGAIASLPILALPTPEGRPQIERSAPLAYLSAERDLVQAPSAREEGVGMLVLADPDFVDARCAEPEEVFESVSRMSAVGETDHGEPTPAFRGKTSRCREFHELYFSRVAQSAAEARDLAVITRQSGMPTGLLLGPEASEESFKRFAPGRRMVHVASHGFALSGSCRTERGGRETSLVRAGIALAGANGRAELDPASNREDGILTAEEVAVLDLTGAECVVLSACESGVGDAITGEGVTGMRRAFHQSGARTLVSSLWKVDDAAARAWMREFYRGLFGDHPEPADAAHAASLTVLRRLRKGGQEPSPALWGAFVVSGVGGSGRPAAPR